MLQTYSPVRFNFVVTAYYVLLAGYAAAVTIFGGEVVASKCINAKEESQMKQLNNQSSDGNVIEYGGKRFVRIE